MMTSAVTPPGRVVLALALAFFSGCPLVQAQDIVLDPVKAFLNPSDPGWRREVAMDSSILKMSIDLASHGKPCVFLALPHSYVKRGGYPWAVYVPIRGGYVETPSDEEQGWITCYPDRIYVGAVSEAGVRRGIVTFTIAFGSGEIDAYWLKGKKMAHKKILAFPFPEEAGNPDGSITSIPMLLKYFPDLRKPNWHMNDRSQRISFDDLRARGYTIPQASQD